MADSSPILFVAGFGRCGTTMVMTMLDRGGFPVAGRAPDYEDDSMMPGRIDHHWLRAQTGKAVKWIAPLEAKIRSADLAAPPVIIHLNRDKREMAASQVKMASAFTGVPNDRRTRKAFERDLIASEPKLVKALNAMGTVYSMTFEWILEHPGDAAQKLGAIIAHEFGRSFDAEAASRVPLRRPARCAPDLSFEASLSESTR